MSDAALGKINHGFTTHTKLTLHDITCAVTMFCFCKEVTERLQIIFEYSHGRRILCPMQLSLPPLQVLK